MRLSTRTRIFRFIWWPFVLFLNWSNQRCLLETFDTIKICDIASTDDTAEQLFCSRTVKALELIKRNDTKRYRRVQKQLGYIVNCRTLMAGVYSPLLRSCDINISKFDFEDEEIVILTLACTIIHEATHGTIHAYNVPYDAKHRMRVERICFQEEVRFARRVMPEVSLGEFDESGYQAHFQRGKWQYAVKSIKNILRPNQPMI